MAKPKSLREAAEAGQKAVSRPSRPLPIDLSMPHESTPAERVTQKFHAADEVISSAQRVMRSEMEAGVHQPVKAADAIAELFGEEPVQAVDQVDVARMAHLLIEEHGSGLLLGLKDWGIVQRIVEAAVRVDPSDL